MSLQIYGDKEVGFSASYADDGRDGADAHANLAACPFCGTSSDLEVCNTHTPSYWVACNNCGAEKSGGLPDGYAGQAIKTAKRCSTLHSQARHLAVNGWNQRAQGANP